MNVNFHNNSDMRDNRPWIYKYELCIFKKKLDDNQSGARILKKKQYNDLLDNIRFFLVH